MDNKDIATLLESLCDRPLAGGDAVPYPEFQAFYCAAAQALERAGNFRLAPGSDSIVDADKMTTALASIVSGTDAETARCFFEEAALRSPSVRLDALSALAFIDGIEQSPQVAPAHLVEQILASDGAAPARPTARRQSAGGIWSLIVAGNLSAPRWRMAAVCALLLVAGGISSSVYWQFSNLAPADGPSLPGAKAPIEQSSISDIPAEPKPALATAQPCNSNYLKKDAATGKIERGDQPNSADTSASDRECDGSLNRQLADRPAEAIAARERAEAARQAAAIQAAAGAAGNASATQAGHSVYQGPAHTNRAEPLNSASGRNLPAAAQSVPAFPPAAVPAASPSAVRRPQ